MLWISVSLLAAYASACVDISYPRPDQAIARRAGQVLVFGHLRFFQDRVEFFPWKTALLPGSAWSAIERHLWLLRLGERAVSPELHPDADGALGIWIASGDYALVGNTEIPTAGSAGYEVLALIRVPDGPMAAYAGELMFVSELREGWSAVRSAFGTAAVAVLPVVTGQADLEKRLGPLPERPVVSPWCVGEHLPGFNDPDLVIRAREILDQGCNE